MKKNHSFLALLTLIILCCFLTGPAAGQRAHETFQKGGKLNAEEVEELEETIAAKPDDMVSRKMLLGYYFRTHLGNKDDAKRKGEHILWFIANDPESEIFQTPYLSIMPQFDLESYRKAASEWEKQLEKDPHNVEITKSAAQWFSRNEVAKSNELAEHGKEIAQWDKFFPELLARNYMHQRLRSNDEDQKSELAKKAYEEFKIAYEMSEEKERSYMTGFLVKAAFAAAEYKDVKKFANEMLENDEDDWNAGNNVHAANNFLGLVAMKSNDIEEAKRRLLAAGETKGSPQLGSFGPNMQLAQELLKQGQQEVVLEYFELCREFWERGGEKLDQWSKDVDDGRIPKFGGNLLY